MATIIAACQRGQRGGCERENIYLHASTVCPCPLLAAGKSLTPVRSQSAAAGGSTAWKRRPSRLTSTLNSVTKARPPPLPVAPSPWGDWWCSDMAVGEPGKDGRQGRTQDRRREKGKMWGQGSRGWLWRGRCKTVQTLSARNGVMMAGNDDHKHARAHTHTGCMPTCTSNPVSSRGRSKSASTWSPLASGRHPSLHPG